MTKSAKRIQRYKHYVADDSVRRVWRAVTKQPQATTRELGDAINLSPSGVRAALRMLRDAGYIDFAPRSAGARTILMGFAEIGGQDNAAA